MVYDYLITLKRPDYKLVDIISQFLYLVAFAAFIYFAIRSPIIMNVYWVSAIILLVCYIILRIKYSRKGFVYYSAGLAIAAITWIAAPYSNWFLFALYAFGLFAEREVKFHKEIGFSKLEVTFNTLIKKRYDWEEFQNVMIKDGLLTLDFRNNKIIQKEIEGEVSSAIEKEFNDFCRGKMEEVERLKS